MKTIGRILAGIVAVIVCLLFTGLLIASFIFSAKFVWNLFSDDTEAVQSTQATERSQVQIAPKPELQTPEKLLELTNAERAKVGVKPLILDERLNQSAQKKVDELAVEGWDDTPHVSDSGVRGVQYALDSMLECNNVSENLARDYNPNPITGFKTSDSHWDAVLDETYEYVGYGITEKYIAVHFCEL